MAAPDRRPAVRVRDNSPAQQQSDWILGLLIFTAIGCAAAGLNAIIADVQWWFQMMGMALLVLGAAAVTRMFARNRWWGTLGAFLVPVGAMTFLFAPEHAILGVIPTLESIGDFHAVELLGSASISSQEVPADADRGIVYLLCLGVAAIAWTMDTVAFSLRMPALAGIPLLVLILVPSLVKPSFNDGFIFALTAAAYLAILLVRARPGSRRPAAGIAAAAIIAALVIPLVVPTVESGEASNGPSGGTASGLNPILTLGDDLRQGDARLALVYTTTGTEGLYLRLTALDEFSGASWLPTNTDIDPEREIDVIGPVPGLSTAIPVTTITTDITVGNIASRWLPAPYAPQEVSGLEGTWAWEPEGLTIRTQGSNVRNQSYEVTSRQIAPTIEQLQAAGTTLEAGLDRYLDVPADLPAVVGETAATAVAGATSFYDQALALQAYFRSGDFTYSEDAPVEEGYDGSGASVLAAFLDAKSGYCVHFSSAMASMARTLGIPARVAVGFTPGEASTVDGETEYRVTTTNFHAWPELYFAGIGWVRFEPTPGRGQVPSFAQASVDDPETPDVDESVPAPPETSAPTSAPTRPPEDEPSPSATPGAVGATPGAGLPWWYTPLAIGVLLALTPWAIRVLRRRRRLALVGAGSATAGWDELRDTADDLGMRTSDARTPRQLSDDLAPRLDDDGARALAALRASVETESFAEQDGAPDPADVRAVLRSLRRGSKLGARFAATVLPLTLYAHWLPAPTQVED